MPPVMWLEFGVARSRVGTGCSSCRLTDAASQADARAQPPIGLSSDLIGPEKTAVAQCANVPITTHCTSELRQPPSGKILLGAAPIETADSPNQILQARN